jgi:hypothetical protein
MQARSRNHCYRGKALRIIYSVCVSAALIIKHANRMRRHLCPDRFYKIFPHYFTKSMILGEKIIEQETYFDFQYNFRLKYFSF